MKKIYSQSEDDTIDVAYPKNTETAQASQKFDRPYFFLKATIKDPLTVSRFIGKDTTSMINSDFGAVSQEMMQCRQLFLDGVIGIASLFAWR